MTIPSPSLHPWGASTLLTFSSPLRKIDWVGPKGGKDHDSARGERPPRPPEVKGRDVTVLDRFLTSRMGRDLVYGKIDLDEALG